MSDNEQNEQGETVAPQPSELEVLKARARQIGVTFSNNIGLEALRARVNEKLGASAPSAGDTVVDALAQAAELFASTPPAEPTGEQPNGLEAAAAVAETKDTAKPFGEGYKPQLDHDKDGFNGGSLPKAGAKPEKPLTERQRLLRENMRLVRCRITNLDPKKADLPGEIFTVANEVIGTVRRFVPYGEATEDGWHIPYVIFKQLQRRKFLHIRTTKDKRTKAPVVHSSWAKEFALEVLDPLTEQELSRLASAQIAAGSVEQ